MTEVDEKYFEPLQIFLQTPHSIVSRLGLPNLCSVYYFLHSTHELTIHETHLLHVGGEQDDEGLSIRAIFL